MLKVGRYHPQKIQSSHLKVQICFIYLFSLILKNTKQKWKKKTKWIPLLDTIWLPILWKWSIYLPHRLRLCSHYTSRIHSSPPRGVLSYIKGKGMCRPKGYGFWAFTGIHFAQFGLESGMVFGVTYRFNSKWVRKKEKYANSKWIWRIFLFPP